MNKISMFNIHYTNPLNTTLPCYKEFKYSLAIYIKKKLSEEIDSEVEYSLEIDFILRNRILNWWMYD